MTDTMAAPGAVLLQSTVRPGRRLRNVAATVWMWGALLVALIPLGAVIYYLVSKGIAVFNLSFLTEDIPASPRRTGGGMGPAVVGTLIITLTAAVMAIPTGILGAIYLHEYGAKGKLAAVTRFMADVMSGVPSIVMGLFIYATWVLVFGLSGFAGALALAALMLPIVIRSTEEMLRLVPNELREASYALGNSKWRTIVTVVLPAAMAGITSGAMLAVARAAGETAPLLFCVGVTSKVNWNVFSGANTALSAQIFANAQTPFAGAQERALGAAFTLVAIVFLLTVLARFISSRYSVKAR